MLCCRCKEAIQRGLEHSEYESDSLARSGTEFGGIRVRYGLISAGAAALAVSQWALIGMAAAQTAASTRTTLQAVAASEPAAASKPSEARGNKVAQPAPPSSGKSSLPGKALSWSQAEIDAARARCQVLLHKLDAVVIPAEAIREGDCGAPAPVRLVSIGTSPQVSLSPPPMVTCELVAALAGWLDVDVQPAARAILGGPVIRLEVMSDYSCRNAYARIKAKLSEHGRANAIDISRFVTERGETAEVRADWGTTERDIRAQIAAKEAAQKVAAGTTTKAEKEGSEADAAAVGHDGLRGSTASADTVLSSSVKSLTMPGGGFATQPALGFGQSSRLGGPRTEPQPQLSSRQRFLRRIHLSACRHFGTVLGPEANEAHRNHFHVDMAERPIKNICE